MDVFNGLLLAPDLDAAFERGFISMEDDGTVLFSPALPPMARRLLALDGRLRLRAVHPAHAQWGRGATRRTGYVPREVIGAPLDDLVAPCTGAAGRAGVNSHGLLGLGQAEQDGSEPPRGAKGSSSSGTARRSTMRSTAWVLLGASHGLAEGVFSVALGKAEQGQACVAEVR